MIEDFLFTKLTMGGETIRIIAALLGCIIGAYYDIFNKRNVPNNFLFGFLAIAIIMNALFFSADLATYTLLIAGMLGLAGYIFYKFGYIGGADVFVIVSLVLLLPIPPSFSSMTVNYPFILFVLIFSFVSSAVYLFAYFALRLMKEKTAKPDKKYLLLIVPYALALYMITNLPFFSPVFFFILAATLLLSIFFMTYRQALNRMMAQELPVSKLEEEDILALEFMDKDIVWKHRLQRLVSADELKRLKKLKISKFMVFTRLPPFLPFVLIGLMLALILSKELLLA